MPDGHDRSKQYGRHKYPDTRGGAPHCEYGCGCWCASFQSGGPVGLDPLPEGICPKNPIDGNPQQGDWDYRTVVEQRISGLGNELHQAQQQVEKLTKRVGVKRQQLADQLDEARKETERLRTALEEIQTSTSAVLASSG